MKEILNDYKVRATSYTDRQARADVTALIATVEYLLNEEYCSEIECSVTIRKGDIGWIGEINFEGEIYGTLYTRNFSLDSCTSFTVNSAKDMGLIIKSINHKEL